MKVQTVRAVQHGNWELADRLSALLSRIHPCWSWAQGTVRFANNLSSALTNGLTGQRLVLGTSYLVSLYAAPTGSPASAFVRLAGPIGISGAPGLYNGGDVVVPGRQPGEPVMLQICAWDTQGGTFNSFEAASASPSTPRARGPSYLVNVGSTTLPSKGATLCPSTSLSITCPGPVNFPNNPNSNTTIVTYSLPAVSSTCGSAMMPVCQPPSGSAVTNNMSVIGTCTVSDSSGNPVSCTFPITVGTPPGYSTQPTSKTVAAGGAVVLTTTTTGSSPKKYQWSFNGLAMAGETNSTLTIPAASAANEGTYFVTVSNDFGMARSQPATVMVLTPPVNGSLISTGAFWRYLFNGSDQGVNWRGQNFDDGAWPAGRAELGFGDGDESTVIGFATNQFITAYFRRQFPMPPAGTSNLHVALKSDDGGIVYLNNTEIFRWNMPTGAVNYLTRAPQFEPNDGTTFHTGPVPANLLLPGVNLLTAEVHQYDPISTDVSFDLQLVSLPSNPGVTIRRFGANAVLSWSNSIFRLRSTTQLQSPSSNTVWLNLPGVSPLTNATTGSRRFFELTWP